MQPNIHIIPTTKSQHFGISYMPNTLKSLRLTQALLSIKAEDTTINTTD